VATLATIEAASLAVALRQHSQGEVAQATDLLPETPGGTDLDHEIAYLVRVAQAYASSPVVRAYRTRVPPRRPTAERALA
jgi:hypothetical protein